jgi:hypothetical protein
MAGAIRYEKAIDIDLALGVGPMVVDAPGGGQNQGFRINLSTFALTAQQTWAPVAVLVHNVGVVDVALLGARPGYPCLATFDGIIGHSNHVLAAYVHTDNVVRVTLLNNDANSSLSVGSGTLRVYCYPVPLT